MVRKLVLAFTGLGVASAVAIFLLTIPLLRRLPKPSRVSMDGGLFRTPNSGSRDRRDIIVVKRAFSIGAPKRQRLLSPIERRYQPNPSQAEKPLRYDRMSGLSPEQLDELMTDIEELLEEPWDKGIGCPKSLTLREAIIITCAYTRQHIIQEVLAEIFDTSQSNVSRITAKFTPLIDEATAADRPSAEEAAEATKGAIALVDGTLWPCWSWAQISEGIRDLR